MVDNQKPRSWWQTLPGILTATAGVITAVTGLIVALHGIGVFDTEPKREANWNVQRSSTEDAPTPPKSQIIHPTKETTGETPSPVGSQTLQSSSERVNLLSPDNGGQVLVASSAQWLKTIDGKEEHSADLDIGSTAVYAFKDEQSAIFDTFRVLIHGTTDTNLKEFELLAGNDSPSGEFKPIGKFQTQNLLLLKDPFQEFTFQPVKAKYLKVRIVSSYGHAITWVYEFQLLGSLEK